MASEHFDRAPFEGTREGAEGAVPEVRPPITTKILIAGGFGAGKTTMVGSISEIRPLHTEEPLTDRGAGVDDVSGVGAKSTTTVAMDFGRITLSDHLLLYLFGTPGQERFWFMWDELAAGAIGAVVIADTRRLAGSFPAVDYFERRGIPFVVAVNCFDGIRTHRAEDIAIALDLDPGVPVVLCDVRRRESSKEVLVALMEHVLSWPDDEPDAEPDNEEVADGDRLRDHREPAT